MIIVRYADDIVVGFQHETDARRFLDMMRDRLEEFALTLHPEKTRLIEFGRYAASNRKRRGLGKPETFTFLGFTFICGTSRRGYFRIHRKSRRDRMTAKLKEIKEEVWRRLHQSILEQGHWLKQVVTGYFAYHAVPTNIEALRAFRFHVVSLWGPAPQSKGRNDVEADPENSRRVSPQAQDPSSLAKPALRRQTPEVGAECPNGARSDLCGGMPAMAFPTAMRLRRLRRLLTELFQEAR